MSLWAFKLFLIQIWIFAPKLSSQRREFWKLARRAKNSRNPLWVWTGDFQSCITNFFECEEMKKFWSEYDSFNRYQLERNYLCNLVIVPRHDVVTHVKWNKSVTAFRYWSKNSIKLAIHARFSCAASFFGKNWENAPLFLKVWDKASNSSTAQWVDIGFWSSRCGFESQSLPNFWNFLSQLWIVLGLRKILIQRTSWCYSVFAFLKPYFVRHFATSSEIKNFVWHLNSFSKRSKAA